MALLKNIAYAVLGFVAVLIALQIVMAVLGVVAGLLATLFKLAVLGAILYGIYLVVRHVLDQLTARPLR